MKNIRHMGLNTHQKNGEREQDRERERERVCVAENE